MPVEAGLAEQHWANRSASDEQAKVEACRRRCPIYQRTKVVHIPDGKDIKPDLKHQLVGSALGSIVTISALTPLGVVKVRVQRGQGGMFEVARNMMRSEGLTSFWRGSLTAMSLGVITTSLYMSLYEECRDKLAKSVYPSQLEYVPLYAGFTSRAITSIVVCPLEVIRINQLTGSDGSFMKAFRSVYSTYGLFGLFKGLGPSLMCDAPFSACFWFTIEHLRPLLKTRAYTDENGIQHVPSVYVFMMSSTAGVLSGILTHPFDVLKTNLQVVANDNPKTMQVPKRSTHVLAQLVAKAKSEGGGMNGWRRVLYRGLALRIATIIPGSGIMQTVYEKVKEVKF